MGGWRWEDGGVKQGRNEHQCFSFCFYPLLSWLVGVAGTWLEHAV